MFASHEVVNDTPEEEQHYLNPSYESNNVANLIRFFTKSLFVEIEDWKRN